MPIARFQMPDGRIGRFEVPDGTSPEQAQALITQHLGQQSEKPAGIETSNPLTTALNKSPTTGILDAASALGSGAVATSVSGLAGIAQGAKNLVSPGMSAADRVKQVAEALTYQPRTKIGKGITEAVSYPFQKLAEGADVVGGKVTDVTGSPAAGTAANVAVQSLPALIGKVGKVGPATAEAEAAANLRKAQGAQADAGIQGAKDAGYVLPPSQVNPSLLNQALEGIGGKIKTAQSASIKNQPVTNSLARKALGLAEDAPLNADTLAAVRSEAGKAYEAVKNVGEIKTDPIYMKALDDVGSLYEGAAKSFPKLQKSEVKQIVDGLKVNSFDAGAAIDQIKILREEADKAFRTGDKGLGKANKAAAQALDDMISRHLQQTPGKFEDYQAARELIAKSYTVQKALKSDGNVDARVLGKDLEKGRPLTSELKTSGQFGAQFPKAAQLPEKIGGVPFSMLDAAVGGGASLMMHNPTLLAAAAGRPLLRSAITSKAYQNAFVNPPNYSPSIVRVRDALAKLQGNPAMIGAEQATGQRQKEEIMNAIMRNR